MLKRFGYLRIILSVLALMYALLPYDLFPDMVIGWGWLDDIIIIYFLWRYFYRGRKSQPEAREAGGRSSEYHRGYGSKRSGHTGRADNAKTALKNPYDILNVERGASREKIKIAYKKMAGKYHPDKVIHLGEEFKVLAEKRFKEIQEAYETLIQH